jgi:hypothetical protein
VAAVAALLVCHEGLQAPLLIEVEPGGDGVGVARAEQAIWRDSRRREAVGHLEQGGAAFADVGAGIVVAVLDKQRPLLLLKRERTTGWQRIVLLCGSSAPIIRPYRF